MNNPVKDVENDGYGFQPTSSIRKDSQYTSKSDNYSHSGVLKQQQQPRRSDSSAAEKYGNDVATMENVPFTPIQANRNIPSTTNATRSRDVVNGTDGRYRITVQEKQGSTKTSSDLYASQVNNNNNKFYRSNLYANATTNDNIRRTSGTSYSTSTSDSMDSSDSYPLKYNNSGTNTYLSMFRSIAASSEKLRGTAPAGGSISKSLCPDSDVDNKNNCKNKDNCESTNKNIKSIDFRNLCHIAEDQDVEVGNEQSCTILGQSKALGQKNNLRNNLPGSINYSSKKPYQQHQEQQQQQQHPNSSSSLEDMLLLHQKDLERNTTSGFAVASAIMASSINNACTAPSSILSSTDQAANRVLNPNNSICTQRTNSDTIQIQEQPNTAHSFNGYSGFRAGNDESHENNLPKVLTPGDEQRWYLRQKGVLLLKHDDEQSNNDIDDDEESCPGYYTPSDLHKLASLQGKREKSSSEDMYSVPANHYMQSHRDDDDASSATSNQESTQASRASSPSSAASGHSSVSTNFSTMGTIYPANLCTGQQPKSDANKTTFNRTNNVEAKVPSASITMPEHEKQQNVCIMTQSSSGSTSLAIAASISGVASSETISTRKSHEASDKRISNSDSSSSSNDDESLPTKKFTNKYVETTSEPNRRNKTDDVRYVKPEVFDVSKNLIRRSVDSDKPVFIDALPMLIAEKFSSRSTEESMQLSATSSVSKLAGESILSTSSSARMQPKLDLIRHESEVDLQSNLSKSTTMSIEGIAKQSVFLVHNDASYHPPASIYSMHRQSNHHTTSNGGLDTFRSRLSRYISTPIGRISLSKRKQSLSPRSRNLTDLKFLTAQHQFKVQQLSSLYDSSSGDDPSNHFDFVLILQAQEVYQYWSGLLDFRTELLGQEYVNAMEECWAMRGGHNNDEESCVASSTSSSPLYTYVSSSTSSSSSQSTATSFDMNEANDTVSKMATPSVGVRRRRTHTADGDTSIGVNSATWSALSSTPVAFGRPMISHSANRTSSMSPGIYSVVTSASGAIPAGSRRAKQQSLFERAIGTPDHSIDNSIKSSSRRSMDTSGSIYSGIINYLHPGGELKPYTTPTIASANPMHIYGSMSHMQSNVPGRRRWGNQSTFQQVKPCQINKLTIPSSNDQSATPNDDTRSIAIPDKASQDVNAKEVNNPPSIQSRATNEILIEEIPPQTIARGIAARTNRTNGMLPFLHAMKRGIVLRRHRPGNEASFCRMFSSDDGDTIQFASVEHEEAMNAFKEQRVRYNTTCMNGRGIFAETNGTTDLAEAQPWSLEQSSVIHERSIDLSVPDYVAAVSYRKKQSSERRIGMTVAQLANKVVGSGSAKLADVVAVHPARNKDPRSDSGEIGSTSLRKSRTEFNMNLSFSLVLRAGTARVGRENIDDLENKWHDRQGSETQFRYIDFEAATEGEYWLVFRGLLLLHRDAAVGRFAKERAAGIGGGADHINEEHTRLHEDEFHEPKTVGCLEKLYVRIRDLDTSYMEGYTRDGARTPPSDYFLGFRSPGTAIWSRLRQAGLETRRIYSLDPRRVMLKVRCPPDRLLDVAEVLRVRLKTKEGTFAPFREDMIDIFESKFDPTEGLTTITPEFQFRSSVRQAIIDFIIGSRIRDSGAELGQLTDLGKMVEARVPLHMHAKLDAIFNTWFYFWRYDNWKGRDGRSLSHEVFVSELADIHGVSYGTEDGEIIHKITSELMDAKRVPGLFTRLFTGCLYQPLDSIEQYFGEKVAFYFTWLQHTAFHLVFLSIAGIFVFILQFSSNTVNHPIRPYFSIIVMLWTFIVLNNWKKRANFMAHRWGTLNYKEQETTRPQFRGDYTRDEVTGEWIVTYPKWKRWLKYCVSFPITLLFTFGTMILILLVHANRDLQLSQYTYNYKNHSTTDFSFAFNLNSIGKKAEIVEMELSPEILLDPTFWIIVVALPAMLGLFLPLVNFFLMRLSIMLNDFENYRTESEYRTYLIIKVFSFRFVCYFATLYYYAFLSVGDNQAIDNGILRVGSGVLIYTTVAQYWQNFLHVCFPILIRKLRMNHRRKRLCNELRNIELEEEEITELLSKDFSQDLKDRQVRLINKRLLLEQAQDNTWLEMMNPQHDSFPEYIQAVVQFTFVSCFTVVLPLTPLIVLVNHLISMRLDAFKLCRGRRRPLAEKTGGIGIWEHLLHIVAVISVLTNCWLMGFTSAQSGWVRERIGEIGVFALIVLWEHVMLLVRYVVSTATSTLPKSVRDAMKKEQYEMDQQRNAIMRARRHQRDHELDLSSALQQHCDDNHNTGSTHTNTLTELNRRALYNKPIVQATTSEENDDKDV